MAPGWLWIDNIERHQITGTREVSELIGLRAVRPEENIVRLTGVGTREAEGIEIVVLITPQGQIVGKGNRRPDEPDAVQ